MANDKEKLLRDFPAVSTEEWMARLEKDLKGVPFEKKLVWKTQEGFNLNPFYRAEDIAGMASAQSLPDSFPYVRSTKMDNEWLVRQDIQVNDPVEANRKALELLERGVTSLGFKLKKTQVNEETLRVLLKDIVLEVVELNFMACRTVAAELTKAVASYIKKEAKDATQCRGSIAFNPFKKELVRGFKDATGLETAKQLLKSGEAIPGYRLFAVDAYLFTNAGAYITQELGYALSWGQELLSSLVEAGFSVEEVASRLQFNFGVGTNYFMEIAKFRAARWLWAEIVGAYGDQYKGSVAKIYQHAITTTWNKTLYDAHVNLLRTQTETMSAALGGVDSITVLPFDITYKSPDEFSERIARNQQLLLKEECHIDKVIDPAAGSYYIEVLTESIANEAWRLFLEMEDEGGFYKVISQGKVQEAVNASNKKRHEAVAKRRESLLGTNQFPNFNETAAEKVADEEDTHSCGCGTPEFAALDFSRGASDFEALRLQTERSGKTPKVFMLTIGNLAMRLARSQFSSNFFATAGYECIDNLGFDTVEEGVDAALKAGADIVCLCSSDDEYATYAIPAHKYLADRAIFVVAGAPANMEELQTAGIEHFVNVRSNVLETLRSFSTSLGINA